MIITFAISILLIAFIMFLIIPWVVKLSGNVRTAVCQRIRLAIQLGNDLLFPPADRAYRLGTDLYAEERDKVLLNTIILGSTFILIGYSSFVMLVIRANANTPINENAPKDAISLLSYLNREQYGDWPILYGQYYNAPITDYEDGNPVYQKDTVSETVRRD